MINLPGPPGVCRTALRCHPVGVSPSSRYLCHAVGISLSSAQRQRDPYGVTECLPPLIVNLHYPPAAVANST